MNKTVLITGSSTGIGRATVLYFAQKGWNVAATMRSPEKETELQKNPTIRLYTLDVTKPDTITTTIDDIIKDFGRIDAIVNNAGYGAIGIFEKASEEEIAREFDTNVFGGMKVIKAILPYFREQKGGVIINVTSMGGLATFPAGSLYHSTKWAMEGFSETLWYELRPLNIKVKLIEPGPIKTDFYGRSMNVLQNDSVLGYEGIEKDLFSVYDQAESFAFPPQSVARTIYQAVTSNNYRLRYTTDIFSKLVLAVRRITPDPLYRATIRLMMKTRLTNKTKA